MSEPEVRLLLVDDHEMFREGLARMLEKESGFVVVGQAKSALDALDRAVSGEVTVVLLDVDLGGLCVPGPGASMAGFLY